MSCFMMITFCTERIFNAISMEFRTSGHVLKHETHTHKHFMKPRNFYSIPMQTHYTCGGSTRKFYSEKIHIESMGVIFFLFH